MHAGTWLPQWLNPADDPPSTFWRSLHYFNAYRLGLAVVLLIVSHFFTAYTDFGHDQPGAFVRVCLIYFLLGLLFQAWLHGSPRAFNLQLTLQVLVDIVILTLLMYFSGGARSGLTFLLLVVLAASGLVGLGRLSLFYAALATLAVLLEQSLRILQLNADPADYMHSGIVSIGFFATAFSARLLAQRVVRNEDLARQRGRELAGQLSINERIIRDMQDGVLIIDRRGEICQFNPRAEELLGMEAARSGPRPSLAHFSSELTEIHRQWRHAADTQGVARVPFSCRGRRLEARLLRTGTDGQALIYVEDMEHVREQAQQIKLAALGRLTANMAHEIRNPLAAISHAAELLPDEQREATRARLARIINDNSLRLNRLVSEVLELGRRDRAQPERLRLREFIPRLIDEQVLHEPQLQRCLQLSISGDPFLMFDRQHLERVLNNLLSNALRHGSQATAGVRVEVFSQMTADGLGAATEVHVIDDGPGISADMAAQIFEPFYTTHSQGTGLGLYIARELCEANGAQLTVAENAPGAHFCLSGRAE